MSSTTPSNGARGGAGIYIGRFQPFHYGHLATVQRALEQLDELLIVLGSAGHRRSLHDPFLDDEREEMLQGLQLPRVRICRVPDFASDSDWTSAIRSAAAAHLQRPQVTLVGLEKDATSFYLRLFPEWARLECATIALAGQPVSATAVRQSLYCGTDEWQRLCPEAIHPAVTTTLGTTAFQTLRMQYLGQERALHATA